MQKFFCGIIVLILSTASFLFAADKKSVKRVENYIAVLDLESVGKVEKDVVRPLMDTVRREIVKSGKYEVLDRSNMDKVMKEQAFQMSGCTSKECAVEAGQLLGVGMIVVGSVSMVGQTYLLSLSLVNVETGKVEDVKDEKCKCEVDELIDISAKVAGKLMGITVADSAMSTTVALPAVTNVDSPQKQGRVCHKFDGRFCDHGDGTGTDNRTGLMWQQKDDGDTRSWFDAANYCDHLSLIGKNDWRLPTDGELLSIVHETKRRPAVDEMFFQVTKVASYWSSANNSYYQTHATSVNFSSGITGYDSTTDHNYVRCVRRQ